MLRRLLTSVTLLTLTAGHAGGSNYCRDTYGYFYHCDDSSWGSGNSWRRWYGEGGYSDLSRSMGRGQVTFVPSGGVQLTCDFSQTGRSDLDGMVTDIVWRKVDSIYRRSMNRRSFFTDGGYSGSGFSDRASYVNIGSVDAGSGSYDGRYDNRYDNRYDGRYDGRYGNSGGYYGSGGGYYGNSGGYNTIGGGYYGGSYGGRGGYNDGFGSSSLGSFSGGYVRDDYLGGSGFGSRPGYDAGFGSGFGSGCAGGGAGCGGGCGGGRPWYRCLDSRSRRRRRHAAGPGGRAASCWVTQGPGWSTLTLARPGPQDEGMYVCVGRSGGVRAVSMEVELTRYVAGRGYRSDIGTGLYRSALTKAEPDRVVEQETESKEQEVATNEVEIK